MKAEQFVKAFKSKVAEIQPTGFGSQWTKEIYPVLELVGKEANFVVNHKFRYREINRLDFVYFPKEELESNWHPPAVIIEHENQYKIEATWKDFWKLCLHAAPLRVMIGYQKQDKEAFEVGCELINRYKKWSLRQIPEGETLLIMGWKQYTEPRQWHIWLLQDKQDDWIYFQ